MPVGIVHRLFPDFYIPCLILVGLCALNCAALIAVLRRTRTDWLFAGPALGGLTVWFIAEIEVVSAVALTEP